MEIIEDEGFVELWREYKEESKEKGVFETLNQSIMKEPLALILNKPEALTLTIHPTAAGHIPVLFTADRKDFESLVQALVYKSKPVKIPASMGACTIKGLNNWDRVRRHQSTWMRENLFGDWQAEWKRFTQNKELYQDTIIIISEGYYSGITPDQLGLKKEEWLKLSYLIRLEHEATHYYTYRMLGIMRKNIVDEIVADYVGIVSATGKYKEDWFLIFMGLKDKDPGKQGRFFNYIDHETMSDEEIERLRGQTITSVKWLGKYHQVATKNQSWEEIRWDIVRGVFLEIDRHNERNVSK